MQLENDEAVRRALQDLASEAPAYQDRPAAPATPPTARRGGRSWLLAAAAVFAVIAVIPVGVYLATTANDRNSPQVGESASDGTREPTPTPRPEFEGADEVRAVGQRLQEAAGDEPGFGKVALDVPARTVTLYWDGEPPPAVMAVRDEAAAVGITVDIVSAQFGTEELVAASYRILRDSRGSATSVMPNENLSGLVVGYLPEDLPTSPEDVDALIEHLEEVSGGIPVELVEGSPFVGSS